jgi:dihydrofolate reductase
VRADIALIAAVAENGVIGTGDDLPWRIRSELDYFTATTMGKPVIMGRRTFESLPNGALAGRFNIVMSRDPAYARPGIDVAASLDEALGKASGAPEIMVIGGAEIYALALPRADRLYLTEVHARPEGRVCFPAFDRAAWRETKREFHAARPGETADYTVTVLERLPESCNF